MVGQLAHVYIGTKSVHVPGSRNKGDYPLSLHALSSCNQNIVPIHTAARFDCSDQQIKSLISLFASTCTYDIQQIKIIFTYLHHTFPSKLQNKTDKIDPDMLS